MWGWLGWWCLPGTHCSLALAPLPRGDRSVTVRDSLPKVAWTLEGEGGVKHTSVAQVTEHSIGLKIQGQVWGKTIMPTRGFLIKR